MLTVAGKNPQKLTLLEPSPAFKLEAPGIEPATPNELPAFKLETTPKTINIVIVSVAAMGKSYLLKEIKAFKNTTINGNKLRFITMTRTYHIEHSNPRDIGLVVFLRYPQDQYERNAKMRKRKRIWNEKELDTYFLKMEKYFDFVPYIYWEKDIKGNVEEFLNLCRAKHLRNDMNNV